MKKPFRRSIRESLVLWFWAWGIYAVGAVLIIGLALAGLWFDIEYTKWKVRQ